MEPLGVQMIEQPAKYWDLEGLALIRNNTTTTIVVDESVETPQDMMRVIRAGAADAVHIKPTVKGGLTMAKKIAAVAEAAGLGIVPGSSAPSGVGIGAVRTFIATCTNLASGTHGSPSDTLVEDIVTNPIPADTTMVQIPSEPGLGIALDEAKVHRYRAN